MINSQNTGTPTMVTSMTMRSVFLVILLMVLSACTNVVKFAYETPYAQEKGEALELKAYLSKPEGSGPFPAVVLLHGCSGVAPRSRMWAQRLNDWGYATLVVDSFGPRGVINGCNGAVSKDDRAYDAYAAKSYLSRIPYIAPNRIAVMGFADGGETAMCAINETCLSDPPGNPFAAAVAFYPDCTGHLASNRSPLLVLIGEKDDWTPAEACHNLEGESEGQHAAQFAFYPDAYHCFDVPGCNKIYMGHRVKYDKPAAEDAQVQVKAFLGQYLH
jgi:dienelactone hydrolase